VSRKALLIGSQTFGLSGVENDVDTMADVLGRRGFTILRHVGKDATRAAILDGYAKLIAEADPDDAFVIYYSGHGGLLREPEPTEPSGGVRLMPPRVQFIVPTDYDSSTDDDFRGIASVELSLLQARLTKVCPNVVVALDCCHSATMFRNEDLDLRVKALYRPAYVRATRASVLGHLDRLRSDPRYAGLDVTGNPDAVRLVACAVDQSSYEYTNAHGKRAGMFTDALVEALAEAGDTPVSWSVLMDRVRRQVLTLVPNQRPEAEGPAQRRLFRTDVAEQVAALPVQESSGGVRLPAARLFGVQVNDELAIMAAGASEYDEDASIGRARVVRVDPAYAYARVQWRAPHTGLPLGAQAYRIHTAAVAAPVRICGSGPGVTALAAAVEATPTVRLAEPDEVPMAEVHVTDDGRLAVHDRIGPLHPPRPATGGGVACAAQNLQRLARAASLRAVGEDDEYAIDEGVTVEWGRVVAGELRPLSTSGEVLYLDERVYVKIENATDRTVYASVIDIGVSGRIALLTSFEPAGVAVPAGRSYLLGQRRLDETTSGVPLSWPEGPPLTDPRPETILVLVSSAPQDISALQHEGVREQRSSRTRAMSPLERRLAEVATGFRDAGQADGPPVDYALYPINFVLSPTHPPASESARFAIDERPEPSVRLWTPRGVPSAATMVAVRLDELVVHQNRALGGTDVRVDAVVLTGGGTDPQRPPYHAATARFSNVRDQDRLPLDRMLLYHGPAVDFLDIAIWVTRDRKDSLALSDLLRSRLTGADFQAAAAQLIGVAFAAPHTAAAVAAIGAGAVVVSIAYELLSRFVGDSIGLYRTTLLAHENFGIGRHPRHGDLHAQDFSFHYSVESTG